ncbi:MAG: hypothetical protein IPP14_05040 [Planctomycetes bacterium]|nr:hypothetical protein [Planctomycetota bacterium]
MTKNVGCAWVVGVTLFLMLLLVGGVWYYSTGNLKPTPEREWAVEQAEHDVIMIATAAEAYYRARGSVPQSASDLTAHGDLQLEEHPGTLDVYDPMSADLSGLAVEGNKCRGTILLVPRDPTFPTLHFDLNKWAFAR